jgi:hypothetical protein
MTDLILDVANLNMVDPLIFVFLDEARADSFEPKSRLIRDRQRI